MRRQLRAIRWSEEEWAAVRAAAAERNLTVSEYVRRTALGRADVSRDDRRALLRQLGMLGNNVNQLAKAANQGRLQEAHPGEWAQLLQEVYDAVRRIA